MWEYAIEGAGALLTVGVTWGMAKSRLGVMEEEIKALKHRKDELLSYKVESHEKAIDAIHGELETLKKSTYDIAAKVDYIYETMRRDRE